MRGWRRPCGSVLRAARWYTFSIARDLAGSLLREHLSTRCGDPVITAPALPWLFDPAPCNPTPFFEPIEEGIERRDAKPDSAFGANRSEGAMLDVPGVVNFNHTAGGDNVIIQTS